jgi:hypothetical protein
MHFDLGDNGLLSVHHRLKVPSLKRQKSHLSHTGWRRSASVVCRCICIGHANTMPTLKPAGRQMFSSHGTAGI